MDTMYGMKIIKESRFGYTRLIDGITMFKLYNCSNITGLESAVHEGVQVVVEISNGCLIFFTGDTFHTWFNTFHRADGSYPSNIWLFSYIVAKECITGNEVITSIQQKTIC